MPSTLVATPESAPADTEGAPVAPVRDAVVTVRERLARHRRYLTGHETRTRILTIDPILRSLGWPVDDPSRVLLEHRDNGSRLDYVLLDPEGNPLAVVEAKRVDQDHSDRLRGRVSGYAVALGVPFAALANGARWEAWQIVAGVSSRRTHFVQKNISSGDLDDIATSLVQLRRENLGTRMRCGTAPAAANP